MACFGRRHEFSTIDNTVQLQGLQDARREFTAELGKLRAATKLAEDRFQAAETRALLEMDRERTTVVKLQKELDSVRASAHQTGKRHRSELAALQAQLGDTGNETEELAVGAAETFFARTLI